MPLANALVRPNEASGPELTFPLDVLRCVSCGLVQLGQVVRPDVMFRSYPYSSSASAPLVAHFDGLAHDIRRWLSTPDALVVEIGSNDGVLLRPLQQSGLRVLGIEPADNLASAAKSSGLDTWNEFFGTDVAQRIVLDRGQASAVVGTNVLAHIDDLRAVLESLEILLEPRGVFVVEVPYLNDLIERVEYDTIYHEHLSYFSLAPLETLFGLAGMEVVDVQHLPVHGGSLRVVASRHGAHAQRPSVEAFRGFEQLKRLQDARTFQRFADDVQRSRHELVGLLSTSRQSGARIAAHGASAKGATLLNYCGIGPSTIEFIADTTRFKQGLLSPGSHIPIVPESAILEQRPDYTLLLAWNYAEDIVAKFDSYVRSGGRFIHPIPFARVLGSA